jgi:glycosyltransferase involved in cell wall biosynthesis
MILFDGRVIGPRLSGIGRYSLNLLRAIDRVGVEPAWGPVRVWVRPGVELPAALRESPHLEWIERADSPTSPSSLLGGKKELHRRGVALIHAPDVFVPLGAPGRRVVTVHDVIPLICRGMLRRSRKQKYLRLWRAWSRRQARAADAVVTVSEHSASDIHRHLGVPRNRIDIIPNAVVPPDTAGLAEGVASATAAGALEARGIDGPFVLCVGRRDPYKNLDGLIRAFAAMLERSDKLPRGLKLVITGASDRRYGEAEREVGRLRLEDRVVFTGYVEDATLGRLYREASLLAVPSLYEGFGLPAIEAMGLGTPVVAGAVASIPEVVGDAALLFDAHRPEALAEAMYKVLVDPQLQSLLVERGRRRAGQFPLEVFGRAHLDLYRRLLERG